MDLLLHLRKRHLDIELHRPLIDEEAGIITFLLFNLSGSIVGYQQYRPNGEKCRQNDPKQGRYFTYKRKGAIALFGIESLHLTPNVVVITEGIFDAVRMTEKGVSALAVLCNDPNSDTKSFLRSLSRNIISVCDNDSAGKNLASVCDLAILTKDKDLGDSDDLFVNEIVDIALKFKR
jgi:DNA primase